MDILRLVIIEKCEGKDLSKLVKLWLYGYQARHFGGIISLMGSTRILFFKQLTLKSVWTQVGSLSGPIVFYKVAAFFIKAEVAVISKATFHE